MENYLQYSQPVNTTMSIKSAIVMAALVTSATVFGIAHGKHTDKTASKVETYNVHNALKISRRENELS